MTKRLDAIARPTLALTRATAALSSGDDPWLQDAPCAGAWYLTDLPVYHGTMTPDALHRAMLPALAMCNGCPFSGADGPCVRRVAPRQSWFDGVAGGIVFRGGKPIRLRKSAQAAA